MQFRRGLVKGNSTRARDGGKHKYMMMLAACWLGFFGFLSGSSVKGIYIPIATFLATHSLVDKTLFIWQDGIPLSRARLVAAVRETLSEISLDHTYYVATGFEWATMTSGHAGIREATIQMLEGWQSSACIMIIIYIWTQKEQLTLVS